MTDLTTTELGDPAVAGHLARVRTRTEGRCAFLPDGEHGGELVVHRYREGRFDQWTHTDRDAVIEAYYRAFSGGAGDFTDLVNESQTIMASALLPGSLTIGYEHCTDSEALVWTYATRDVDLPPGHAAFGPSIHRVVHPDGIGDATLRYVSDWYPLETGDGIDEIRAMASEVSRRLPRGIVAIAATRYAEHKATLLATAEDLRDAAAGWHP